MTQLFGRGVRLKGYELVIAAQRVRDAHQSA